MTEIYKNVSEKVKEIADTSWQIAIAMKNPVKAAKFLDSITNFYKNQCTEEEIEFLQFYFNMKMEMIKE